MRRLLLLLAPLLLAWTSAAPLGTLYVGTTAEPLAIAWCPNPAEEEVTGYEARLVEVIPSSTGWTLRDYPAQASAAPEITLALPHTGHYLVEVRAVNAAGASDWARSDAPQGPPGTTPRPECGAAIAPWWVYGHPAAPGPLTLP